MGKSNRNCQSTFTAYSYLIGIHEILLFSCNRLLLLLQCRSVKCKYWPRKHFPREYWFFFCTPNNKSSFASRDLNRMIDCSALGLIQIFSEDFIWCSVFLHELTSGQGVERIYVVSSFCCYFIDATKSVTL